MIARSDYLSKIRSLGYAFKDKTKRSEVYRRKGTTDFIIVPFNSSLSETTVREALTHAGCTKAEIDQFIKAYSA